MKLAVLKSIIGYTLTLIAFAVLMLLLTHAGALGQEPTGDTYGATLDVHPLVHQSLYTEVTRASNTDYGHEVASDVLELIEPRLSQNDTNE